MNEKNYQILKKTVTFLAVISLVGLIGYSIAVDRPTHTSLVGKEAFDFTLELFDGRAIKLSDLRGKVVIMNFWASWCVACKDEARVLEWAWQNYKDRGVVVLGVDIWDTKEEALKYINRFAKTYPIGFDKDGDIVVNYGISGVPETYFIDSGGKIANKYVGPLSQTVISQYIQDLLSQNHSVDTTQSELATE